MRGSIFRTLALAGVLAISLIAPALARDVKVTGEVSFAGRVVLPAGAELQITLVRLVDGERVALVDATATLLDRGASPLIYNFDIHDGVIQPRTRYGLIARVFVDGKLVLQNRRPARITPRGGEVMIDVAPVARNN